MDEGVLAEEIFQLIFIEADETKLKDLIARGKLLPCQNVGFAFTHLTFGSLIWSLINRSELDLSNPKVKEKLSRLMKIYDEAEEMHYEALAGAKEKFASKHRSIKP